MVVATSSRDSQLVIDIFGFLVFLFGAMTVKNPDVNFAGFVITENKVKPLPKYLDIRSWFGLVNQVSHYARLTNLMAPFRNFLSPNHKFEWNSELEETFLQSKKEIIAAIEEGVRIFDPNRVTVLNTDWSEQIENYSQTNTVEPYIV